MQKLNSILEKKGVIDFLHKRSLIPQYYKAKTYLLSGNKKTTKFKERKPKGSNVWLFRINRQFRAIGMFDFEGNLIVYEIDNHQ